MIRFSSIHSIKALLKAHFTTDSLWGIYWLAGMASMLTTLHLPYIGEESVYAVTSQEMWYYDSWLRPLFFGEIYGRPPLYNWLILLFIRGLGLGLDQVLLSARLVSILMTGLTSLVLYHFVYRLSLRRPLALLSAAIYLSGDLLLRRGWLSYSDPTFSFFCFSSCAWLWLALHQRRLGYLVGTFVAVTAAFLTKAITAYVFLAVMQFVLCFYQPYRTFVFKHRVTCLYSVLMALSFCASLGWYVLSRQSTHGSSVLTDIWNQFSLEEVTYFIKVMLFPVDLWIRFLPTSLIVTIGVIAAYRAAYRRGQLSISIQHICVINAPRSPEGHLLLLSGWMVFLNLLPYWIAPQMRIRYLLPLYPFIAIILACLVLRLRSIYRSWVTAGLLGMIVLRVVLGLYWFPYYENRYRGDSDAVAKDWIMLGKDKPLYTNYHSSIGINIVAYANQYRLLAEESPVRGLKEGLPGGLFLSNTNDYKNDELIKTYWLGRTPLYLYARNGSINGDGL